MEQSNQTKLVGEHFSHRSLNYDKDSTWVRNEEVLKYICNYLPKNDGMLDVLDLGCGTGAVCDYINSLYSKQYNLAAVDICYEMLNQIKSDNITKYLSDVEKLPFDDETYDAIVSRQCLHYVNDINAAIRESVRVLKMNGIFVLAQITPYDDETAEYWKEMIKIRQPLRKWFFTINQWNVAMSNNGLSYLNSVQCSHRSSIKKWKDKYSVTDLEKVDTLRSFLENADSNFKKTYDIQISDDDITYSAFWHIAKYVKH